MTLKERLHKAAQRTRVIRYKAYKRVGVAKHRHKIDFSLFLIILWCLATLPFFILPTKEYTSETLSSVSIPVPVGTNPEAEEVVHEDLGDAPVEQEQQASLIELEKRAQLGEVSVDIKTKKKGDSLLSVLADENISATERLDIAEAFELLIDLRALQLGTPVMFFKDAETNTILGVSIQIKPDETVSALREENGSWTPFSQASRIESHTTRLTGSVERTFAGSAAKALVPESIITQVINALDGEVDFQSDIHAGDTFDVIFETKTTQSGLEIGAKQLLFIGLQLKDKNIYRYYYTDHTGTPGFYDARGKSGEKVLLKRPLKARARLSSPYGRRRHPVLLYEIFHHGVDLAAPKGTPIMAAADGTILQIGRKGAYGKYIRIKHDGNYYTAYGHMNGYRADLKPRSKVKRGEVIGYVGSTGRSTGPHLHFEVWKGNKTVPPFGHNAIPSKQLKNFELEQFVAFAEGLHPDYIWQAAGTIPDVPPPKPIFK